MIDDFIRPSKRRPKAPEPVVDSTPSEPAPPEIPVALEPTSEQPPVAHADFEAPQPQYKKHKRRFRFWPFYRKRDLFFVLLGLVLLTTTVTAAWFKFVYIKPVKQDKITVNKKKAEPPAPKTLASPLTGVQVEPALATNMVTGVMIENSPDARPQSGLKDAGVVYEAVAEGGITRFLALFQETKPDYIGPVRSARPYYLDWALPFNAGYAHVGGSPDALSQIKSLGIKDLDQFANAGAYQRVTNRYAPHNVYTSIAKLEALEQAKGFTYTPFTPFPRKEAAKPTTPTAKTIDFAISSFLYNAHYDYDATTNTYKRSEGGAAHTDEKTGAQLAPNVVIALVMTKGLMADGVHTTYGTTGTGAMFVFQDGQVTPGTWSKADRQSQFKFTDAAGAELKLNPGQTWISIVPNSAAVKYVP